MTGTRQRVDSRPTQTNVFSCQKLIVKAVSDFFLSHFGCIFLVLDQPIIAKVPHEVELEEQTARDSYEIVEAHNDVNIEFFKAKEIEIPPISWTQGPKATSFFLSNWS